VVQTFDLMTMKASEADFTTSFEIKAQLHPETSQAPASDIPAPSGPPSSVTCYALAVWFDTDFTARFCKDHPVKLSTSPFAPKTHWQQTILTLKEPVTLAPPGAAVSVQGDAQVGSKEGPAKSLAGRISIVKSTKHRSIDISIELTAVAASGSTKKLPIQIFEL
jgi:protein arginine N-methyltransferase 3